MASSSFFVRHLSFSPDPPSLSPRYLADAPANGAKWSHFWQISRILADPGEVSDPKWGERFEMLETIVHKCLDALPGENKPLPNREEARKKVALSRRFLAVDTSLQMEQFAKSLTQEEQEVLFEMIDNGISSHLHMQDADRLDGIAQRDTALRRFLMSN